MVKKMARKTTSVNLTEINQRILDALCSETGQSQSQIINAAITQYFQYYQDHIKAELDRIEQQLDNGKGDLKAG